MFDSDQILDKLKEILVEEFCVDENAITADANLVTDLGVNSLELAELAERSQEEFGITIEDEDIPSILTIGDLQKYIFEKQN